MEDDDDLSNAIKGSCSEWELILFDMDFETFNIESFNELLSDICNNSNSFGCRVISFFISHINLS